MEKVFIKPVSSEITAGGGTTGGYADVFSYEADSPEISKNLGSLFIVGHVRHESDDMAYIINLVAALARREYYSKPSRTSKENFSASLKKINEVVQEFFRNQELDMSIGIFAISGNNILISKLGKFKILLARDNKNIDILNNVQLFTKEHVDDNREFSNIISGNVRNDDRILAFYPGQSISSRERYIKSDFLKLAEPDFVNKISSLKTKSGDFSCALLYITMRQVKVQTAEPRIQPQELMDVQLARQSFEKQDLNGPTISQKDLSDHAQNTAELASKSHKPDSAPATNLVQPSMQESLPPLSLTTSEEMPRIIPSEFALGKRAGTVAAAFKRYRIPHPRLNFNVRNRYWYIGGGVLVVAALFLTVRAFFLVSPETRQAQLTIQNINKDIQSAKNKISLNDSTGARNLLMADLNNLQTLADSGNSKLTEPAAHEVFALMDDLDKVQDASPALVFQVADDLGKTKLLSTHATAVLVYSFDDKSNVGTLSEYSSDKPGNTYQVNDLHPDFLFENEGNPTLLDRTANRIAALADGKLKSAGIELPASFLGADMYKDNLYVLSADGIYKMVDAATKSLVKPQAWLAIGATVVPDGISLAIDGSIYILSRNGTITTYYKGKQSAQISTPFQPSDKTLLLTPADSSEFYLLNRDLNRIYIIDRKTGNLSKTYKITTDQQIISAAVGGDNTIYFLTPDNKVWKIQ